MPTKQEIFDKAYKKARKTHNTKDSIKIAEKVVKNYKPSKSEPKKVTGKKSFSLDTSNYNQGNVLDILVGYPEPDTEEIYGGKALDPSGWKNVPDKPMTFDLNHFGYDLVEGVRNDLDEKWQNFKVKVSDWFYDESEGLKAKAYIPESEQGKEFLDKYQQGEFGVSIEYKGLEENNLVKDWEIIGGTFHSDPSYTKTKPKKH